MTTYEAIELYNEICTEIKSDDLIYKECLSLDAATLEAKDSFLYDALKKDVYVTNIDSIDHLMFKDTMIACRSETEVPNSDGSFEYVEDGLYVYYPRPFIKIVKLITDVGLNKEFDDMMNIILTC
jgi:hypothetical protein